MKKTQIFKLSSFIIALTLVLFHIIQVSISRYSITTSVLYGGIGLLFCLILILLKQSYWKFVFLGLIIISFSEYVNFYNQTHSIGINSLEIELTPLILFLIHIAVNPELLSISKTKPNQ